MEDMDRERLEHLAGQLLAGALSLDQFIAEALATRSAVVGPATLDLDRSNRCGFPEVVFGEGKSVDTLHAIINRMQGEGIGVLVTRLDVDKGQTLVRSLPGARYHPLARTLRVPIAGADQSATSGAARSAERDAGPSQSHSPQATSSGRVAIVTAGTSDLPVAEEARETLDWMGVETLMIHDVGVAGPHRIVAQVPRLRSADAVVVVAGMEGALPSVVGGYVACPVIAVPTSVGYGASFGGVAALLSMLNSCAANVCVVNIDAGFKAAYVAGLIARRSAALPEC